MKCLSRFLSDGSHQVFVGNAKLSGIKGGIVFFLAVSVEQKEEAVGDFVRSGYSYGSFLVSIKTVYFQNK